MWILLLLWGHDVLPHTPTHEPVFYSITRRGRIPFLLIMLVVCFFLVLLIVIVFVIFTFDPGCVVGGLFVL